MKLGGNLDSVWTLKFKPEFVQVWQWWVLSVYCWVSNTIPGMVPAAALHLFPNFQRTALHPQQYSLHLQAIQRWKCIEKRKPATPTFTVKLNALSYFLADKVKGEASSPLRMKFEGEIFFKKWMKASQTEKKTTKFLFRFISSHIYIYQSADNLFIVSGMLEKDIKHPFVFIAVRHCSNAKELAELFQLLQISSFRTHKHFFWCQTKSDWNLKSDTFMTWLILFSYWPEFQ